MHKVIYVSTAAAEFSATELDQLLEGSRRNNARRGLTGLLLYHRRSFLQLLEGPESEIRALLAVVERDPRHAEILTLLDTPDPTGHRLFPDWTMGFERPQHEAAIAPEGLRAIGSQGAVEPTGSPASRACLAIIDQFRANVERWREEGPRPVPAQAR